MRSLKTLVGFVLILGLLTLGVVGLDYLGAAASLKLAFAFLLGAFGLIAFGIAITARPTAGSVLASAAAVIALFVAIRGVFTTTLDLLLFALIIFDVIVLFVLFGDIDRFDRRARARRAKVVQTQKRAPSSVSVQAPVQTAPAKKAVAAKKPATKTTAKKPAAKKAVSKKPASKSRTAVSVAQFVASKNREGGSFHTVNCYIARRIPQADRIYFATREGALKKGYKPCRVCNP